MKFVVHSFTPPAAPQMWATSQKERRICFCFQVREKQILRYAQDDTHEVCGALIHSACGSANVGHHPSLERYIP
jgi:hypothetical protein